MSRNTSRTVIVVISAVIGGILLIGAFFALVTSTFMNRDQSDQLLSAEVDGVTMIDVRMSAGDMAVEFDDTPTAVLDVTNGMGTWELTTRGDTLVVEPPRSPWFNLCLGGCDHQEVVLTLPNELQSSGTLNGSFELSAGKLVAQGSYDRLDVQLSAGEMTLDVEASVFTSRVSAGELNGAVANVTEGAFRVSAGSTVLALDGDAPGSLTIDVSAGGAELRLPDAEYHVSSDVSAGEFNNNLRTNPASSHTIDVDISAGSATLGY